MKVLIYEHCFDISGHRIPYAGLTAQSFPDCEVIVCLPSQLQNHPELSDHFPNHVKSDFYESLTKNKKLARIRESWRCFRDRIKSITPDLVVVPTADRIAFWGGLMNSISLFKRNRPPIDICLMRGHHCSARASRFKKFATGVKWSIITRGPWRRILVIDPRSFELLKRPETRNIVLCPDPAPAQLFHDSTQARKVLGLPTAGKMIVSVGNQEHRKGSDLLLLGFVQADLPPEDFLVMMGKFDEKTKVVLEQLPPETLKRIIVRDSFVTDDELQQAVVASDLVAVPYRDVERPSGIVSRAVAWNRPLIGTDQGWIQWFINRYEAGYLTNPHDIGQFALDLQIALTKNDNYQPSPLCEEFRNFNTSDQYLRTWNSLYHLATEVEN